MRKPYQNEVDNSVTTELTIHALASKASKATYDIISSIQALERKAFPSSESLQIAQETQKRNTRLLYAQSPSTTVVGYLVYIDTSSGLRIHKVCVSETFRRQGIATMLIERVCEVARKTGKDIDLWVDEARIGARKCYSKVGFEEVGQVVMDYYGPGRNGIRMVLNCV